MICELYLPFPPTINNYYKKSHHGGRYISEKGRMFRDQVAEAIRDQTPGLFIDEQVLMEVVLFPPDKRTRDVDNYNKPLLDALTNAKIWEDDCQVDQLFNYRGEVRKKQGSVYVRIDNAGPIITNVEQLPIE